VVFVPHWKYVDNTRVFRLHVPTGYTSALFTHLPSRTIFIDADRYFDETLGYWLAHELGHLVTNSAKEQDAENAAREFRKRLEGSRKTRR
jgi:Zn-dependent peptidase ImmA (M78 family)